MGSLLRYEDLERIYSVDRRSIQRWIRSRGFPRPVELSAGTVRFRSHEVDIWERAQAAKRGPEAPMSESEAFQQLNELLSEATGAGDFALEMSEENEEYAGEPDAYYPGPITLVDLFSSYLDHLRDPRYAAATRAEIMRRPQLAAFLRSFAPLASETYLAP